MSKPLTVSSQRLRSLFYNVSHVIIPDTTYWMYTREFIVGKGYTGFQNWLFQSFDILDWKPNYDCDNWSSAFKFYMQSLHFYHNHSNSKTSESVAIGEVYYQPDNSKIGHAINVAVIPDYVYDYKKLYIEPQTGKEVILTSQEEDSIYATMF